MNRFLNILAFIVFATALFLRAVDPIIPQIAVDFTISPATAALLSTAFALPYAFVQPVLGAMADTLGKQRLMLACLLILVGSSILSALAPSFPLLFGSRIVAGIASGGIFPIALAIVGDRVPIDRRQVAIGRVLAAAITGNLLGASVAGIVADLIGWRGVFFGTAAVGALVLAVALYALRGFEKEQPARLDFSTIIPSIRQVLANPLAKICFTAVCLEGVFVFGIFPYVAALLYDEGETRAAIAGLVLAGFSIGGIIYSVSVSMVLGRAGERPLMIAGGALMAAGLFVVGLQTPWFVEFAAFVLIGLGFYSLHGCIQVYATELAPKARGAAMALHSAFFFGGSAIGPVFYGFGIAHVGIVPSVTIGAVVLLVLGIVCSRLLRHPETRAGT